MIISGGGTGGHIYPAISIANALKEKDNSIELLFVGATGRMEMEKIPAAGYKIIGLPVAGFKRKFSLDHLTFFFKLVNSMVKARKILNEYKPGVVVGVGGYASGPILRVASRKKIPTVIQEQNSVAGITNKILAKKAMKICVAYHGMEKYFPAEKIIMTGNPVRRDIENSSQKREEALPYFHLDATRKVILILGGSLGAKTINQSIMTNLETIIKSGVQIIWQTGKLYREEVGKAVVQPLDTIKVYDFINRMDLAYAAADVIVSRAGAGSISELCMVGKPVILIPSPNVAEDHQTKNAMALVSQKAAIIIKDAEAVEKLIPEMMSLVNNQNNCAALSLNISKLAIKDSAGRIADEILNLIKDPGDRTPVDLKKIKNVYLLGIGGIGMSAVARYFKHLGLNVAGYDLTPTSLTKDLQKEGIDIHFEDNIKKISIQYLDASNNLVVYTPAIPNDHSELNYFRNNGSVVIKRAKILGLISKEKQVIAIAGTHGKTTTSTTTAHLLKQSHIDCNAFLGGISKNYGTNLLLSKTSPFVVVEADEFDRSFLQLYPQIAVITSVDADHLDIYGTKKEVGKAFNAFARQIHKGGTLIYKKGIDLSLEGVTDIHVFTYSIKEKADFYAENISQEEGFYTFDIVTPLGTLKEVKPGIPGLLNVENAVAAVAASITAGATHEEIKKALSGFLGVKRRFETLLKNEKIVYIDDYAHHPEELKACILSVRNIYKDKKITGIFQPHLYTRTRDFAEGFAESLSLLDEVILLTIYPARELPIEGVTSEIIFKNITSDKILCSMDQLVDIIKQRQFEVLITMGAGNIDQMVEPVRDILIERTK